MKRLLTHSQLKHTKQAANKFLTCFIVTIMAVLYLFLPQAYPRSLLLTNRIKVQNRLLVLILNRAMAQLTKSIILKARILVTVLMAVTLGVIMGLTVDCQMDQIQIRTS